MHICLISLGVWKHFYNGNISFPFSSLLVLFAYFLLIITCKRERGDLEVAEGRERVGGKASSRFACHPISSLIHLQDLEDREMGDRQ